MSDSPLRVSVTNHALDRYRERVALYADATAHEIIAAVRAAVPLTDADVLPFARVANTRYFRHAEMPDVYFVTEPLDRDLIRVVTVIDRRVPPKVPPKARRPKQKRAR